VTSASRTRRWNARAARAGSGTGVTAGAYLSDATDWAPIGSDRRPETGGIADAAKGAAAEPADMNSMSDQVHGRVMQVGVASWYGGSRWQGHMTSMGTRYDDAQLTAAHATLPLGSKVLVALPGSGRSVVVTITDRPGTRRRIIDLSRAAAAALGILDRGVATVSLTPL
jgi:rare lipoprotein A (peptidoglycan hydrolase)